ncbi:MAG: PEP-CTERM sorting domain-containing protein [Pirellulales bacterium]|nr:PEP-CTERM sorting domain-containing protein [Pirellulales bacterium]
MKKASILRFALAILVVGLTVNLALAETVVYSTTENGIELQVIRQPNPVAGLESYLVRVLTNFEYPNTFTIIEPIINGVVHQCEHTYAGTLQETILLAQIRDGESSGWTQTGWTDLHTAADTHVIVSEDSGALNWFGQDMLVEGNNGLNPYGLNENGGLTRVGLGQITGGSDISFQRLGLGGPMEMDLAQVVIPSGTIVLFRGRVVAYDPSDPLNPVAANFVDVPIGVPEPSSIALAVMGGLCLLTWRMRRK